MSEQCGFASLLSGVLKVLGGLSMMLLLLVLGLSWWREILTFGAAMILLWLVTLAFPKTMNRRVL